MFCDSECGCEQKTKSKGKNTESIDHEKLIIDVLSLLGENGL